MKKFRKFILLSSLIISYTSSAQQIQTDRPNETEGPSTISAHHLQVETGFSFEKQDDEKTFEVPALVMRYGLFKNAEFRLESAFKIEDEQNSQGIQPLVVGFKYHVLDHKGILPDLALLGRVSIPWLADNAYQEENYSPEIRLLAQHSLSKTTHLGYNIGIEWLADTARPEYIYTLSVDHSLNKKIKLIAEAYGFTEPHHHAQNSADVAVLYLLKNNMQLDVIAGSGIMNSPQSKFIELGFSFKI